MEVVMKTQDEIDKGRRQMAEEIVQAQNLTTLEEAKEFATKWIVTAAQYATNADFYRDRTLHRRTSIPCDVCGKPGTCFGADLSRYLEHCGSSGCTLPSPE